MRTLTAMPLERAWAMEEGRLAVLARAIESALSADGDALASIKQTLSMTRREARNATAQENGYTVENGIAVVTLHGVMTKTPTCFGAFFGGDAVTSDFVDSMNAAAADATVREIAVNIDSPGGSVDGTAEAADATWAARQRKPVTAYVDGMAASGAYWVASQATRIVINNATARVGSIGVYAVIPDTSRAYENRGVRVHVVKAGVAKGSGIDGVPVTADVLADVQREVSSLYEEFVGYVARGRGISAEQARALADGRVHVGRAAIELGLVDGIASLEEVMAGTPPAVAVTEQQIDIAASEPHDNAHTSAPKEAQMPSDTMMTCPECGASGHGPYCSECGTKMGDGPPDEKPDEPQQGAALAAVTTRLAALEAENGSLKASVAGLTADRDADRLVAELKGEHGGPVRLAAKDAEGEQVVRARVAEKGLEEARGYFTGALAVLGKGAGSIAGKAAGPAAPPTRNHFDAIGPAKWAGSPDPVMQEYGRKIEWIDAAEKAGRNFKTAAEAFAAYGAAHKSAA